MEAILAAGGLWGLLAGSILVRNLLGIIDPEGDRVRQAVGNAIMSIITLDAVLAPLVANQPSRPNTSEPQSNGS